MNSWLYCCGGILLLAIGALIVRVFKGRSSTSYSASKRLSEASETTKAELASVTPKNSETDSELEDFTDYSVGNYSVGEDYEQIVPSTQINNDKTSQPAKVEVGSGDLSTPSFGANDADILPDWLKGDSEESSKPVNNDGVVMNDTYNSANATDGSKVHDEFGLAEDTNDEEEKKKTQ